MPTPKKTRAACLHCGEDTKRPASVYCSIECFRETRKAKLGQDAHISQGTARRRMIEEVGCVCQICGITEWMGRPVPVVMDHVDGNHTNNSRLNLRLVCHNCDAQLPTYKNKNAGNGRASRMVRYHSGLSY